jgi:hypothetical protein
MCMFMWCGGVHMKIITHNLLSKNIFSKIMIVFALLVITVSFTTNDVYGHHLSQDMKWQLVYITHNSQCSNYDIQMTRTYSEITSSYLESYQLENTSYDSLCLNQYDEYSRYAAPLDLDLIVIVLDKDIGRQELNTLKIGGYYHHAGPDPLQNHAIVICDCPTFNFSSPIWILTHELSHFVLTYLDYDLTLIEDMVHTNDVAYDKCIASHGSCGSAVMKIRSETSAYSYSVMPLYEPAIGAPSLESLEVELPVQVVELSKVITKWWTEEKISDGDFYNTLGFMTTGNSLFSQMNPEILTADTAFDSDDASWKKLISSNATAITSDLLSRIPKNLLSNENLLLEEGKIVGMPEWFKTTAKWWINGEISDDDFRKNINFLRNEGLVRPR